MTGPVVIIGAGPAGMSAAKVLVRAGLKPVVLDEAPRSGGQVFRQPQPELARPAKLLYGLDAGKAIEFRKDFSSLSGLIDYRPDTLVWGVTTGALNLIHAGRTVVQPWSTLIIATGAMDRIVPVKGWTALGVYSLGGAQIALKADASMIGRRVAFAGTGPLLYLVAYQYAQAGARVEAVLEAGEPFSARHFGGLVSGKTMFVRGLYYMAALRARGVRLLTGVELREAIRGGNGWISGVAYRWRGRDAEMFCDALAIGYGLKAETQIADLLGADFVFDEIQRQWLPQVDKGGRSTVPNVYLAGDGLSVRGSDVAAASGRIAASALLMDSGYPPPRGLERDRRLVVKSARFRRALDQTFAFPGRSAAKLSDDVVVCRCEELTAGTIRQAVIASGETQINRIKAFCRVGMGRCQGRICGPTAAELIAETASVNIDAVGRLRAQAPIKPLTLGELARRRS